MRDAVKMSWWRKPTSFALVAFGFALLATASCTTPPQAPDDGAGEGSSGNGGKGGSSGNPASSSGSSGSSGTSSSSSSGGDPGGGGGPGRDDQTNIPSGPNTNPGFKNLAPPMGQPLDPKGTPLDPPPPQGWVWYQIDGAVCRDGSPTGFYVHYTNSDKLVWYLEGGGACATPGFCDFNPANVGEAIFGPGESCLGSALGSTKKRQEPGPDGIFNTTNAANPFKDWNMIYVPYCTGDIHAGAKPNATVPNVAGTQQFVGYLNMLKFTSRIVPTFKDKVKQVVLTGASAGGFGAGMNFSMVQDSFGDVNVKAIDDSGPPFNDKFMPVCMQKRWRALWGLDDMLPPDCTECRQADGGGLLHFNDFLLRKHPNLAIAIISSQRDEIIRDFYSMGDDDCARFETSAPIRNYMGGACVGPASGNNYSAGLDDLKQSYEKTGKFAGYMIDGTKHQHIWRARFFEAPTGGVTIAKFVTDFINHKNSFVIP
jgi:hypothetical protein